MADVSIVHCRDYSPEQAREALLEALNAIGGLDFVTAGMKIVIKANLVSAKKPQAAATTHPILISELIKLLKERGAESIVVGDSPGGLFNGPWLNGIYNATGMGLCKQAGGKLNDDFTVKSGDCGGRVLHSFTYTAYLENADAIIDFAKLKTHGMMVMTGAVKNLFGAIPGATKPEYHSRFPEITDFAGMLVDLYEYFKPTLSIIDGVYGMEGNGPTAGTPRYVGGLIASKSGHYADMVAAQVMGIPLEKLPLFCEASNRGLCPKALEDLSIFGNVDEFRVEDYQLIEKASSNFSLVVPKPMAWLSDKVFRTRPVVIKKDCVGCELCYNTCPKAAIAMDKGKPRFDYDKCIRCFCCQEFCPKGAIRVKRTAIAKLISRE